MVDWFKILDLSSAVAGIVGIIVVVKIFVDFIKNHISHSTQASQRLADMIEQMLRFLERNNK